MDNVLNISIEKMLLLGYELEGLLLSAGKRGDATPVAIWNLISEKADEIHAAAVNLSDIVKKEPHVMRLISLMCCLRPLWSCRRMKIQLMSPQDT